MFIIIAIVIVVIGALIYFLVPRITTTTTFDAENPERFLQDCVEDELNSLVKDLAMHGIDRDPAEPFVWYNTEKINYLCYTPNYGEACTRSPPFLATEFENQINENIKTTADNCFNSLVETYTKKSFTVSGLKQGTLNTEILPNEIRLNLEKYELTVSKGNSQTHKSFTILLNNNLYELLTVSSKILEDETLFGEADRVKYMLANLNLRITASEIYGDGTIVYIVENKNTGEKFQFASRSKITRPGL